MVLERIKSLIRDVPDFPRQGILFKDITPVLRDPEALEACLRLLTERMQAFGADVVAGPESRGFILGAALATRLGLGFVPIRKPGKLPWRTRTAEYALEYGTDSLQIHEDAVGRGHRVILVDDLLATGGTMQACATLVAELGGEVAACGFMIELGFLRGRERLQPHRVESLISY